MDKSKDTNKNSYSKTVFLPVTSFSMRGDLPKKEPLMLQKWQENHIYEKMLEKRRSAKPFILHDGPPYANGDIHIGHALNKILKDIIIKAYALQGHYTPYVPGWDCHGLPIEQALLKEMKMGKRHIEDIPAFRRSARAFARRFVDIQREGFKRLGVFADWEHPYITMTDDYEGTVIKAFRELKEKGHIHRDKKTIHWCMTCETALADAEVEYKDASSPSIYVRFVLQNLPAGIPADRLGNTSIVIWTTTPWTLPSNMAAAVAEDEEYVVLESEGQWLIVADKLADTFIKDTGISAVKGIKLPGKSLVGLKYTHCLAPHLPEHRRFPRTVISTDFVEMTTGTGIVHIAPGHGEEDFFAGKKWGLEVFCPVKEDGTYNADAGEFEGMKVFDANPVVAETLKKDGLLLGLKEIMHSYPHCWRCRKPIIFRATEQWFLKVDLHNLRDTLLEEAGKVRWLPESGRARMEGMLKTRPDWCLSRQRYWGTPILAFYCRDCGKVYDNPEVLKRIEERVFREGSDFWFSETADQLLGEGHKCSCGCTHFRKEKDIMDVWLDSGVSWYAVVKNGYLGKGDYLPVDLYLEGSDQHRGWFQTSLIPSVALNGRPPFRSVLTHGMVLDEKGLPMHKSAGNSVSPQEVTKKFGAEILRLWAALCDYSGDVRISMNLLKGPVDTYRKMRNTLRYLLGNLSDFNPEKDKVAYENLQDMDKYMLARLAETADTAAAEYREFHLRNAIKAIADFCNLDLSAFYLDSIKDRMYTLAPDCAERRSAQTVLYTILPALMTMMAPVLSFTADEAWNTAREELDKTLPESVFLSDWPVFPSEWKSKDLLARWEKILQIREKITAEIEKLRAAGEVGSSLEASITLKASGKEDTAFLKSVAWTQIAIVSEAEVTEDASAEGIIVTASKTTGKKCPRCWQYRRDIGSDPDYPEVCGRCADVLKKAAK